MMRVQLILAVLVIGLCNRASAQEAEEVDPSRFCASPETAVVFTNGMFTSRHRAQKHLDDLRDMIRHYKLLNNIERVSYELAYNEHESALTQWTEVINQATSDIAATEGVRDAFDILNGKKVPPPKTMETLQRQLLDRYKAQMSDADLREHLKIYTKYLRRDARLLMVGHSQGNFYVNRAFELLVAGYTEHSGLPAFEGVNAKRLGVISVANPAAYVAGGFDYVTFKEDTVINGTRLFTENTLDGNLNIQNPAFFDPFNHGFRTYLDDKGAGPRIRKMIQNAVAKTEAGHPIDFVQVVDALLENPDGLRVWLWVREADGTELSTNLPLIWNGSAGYFDEADEYGNSHYGLNCEHLGSGSYDFGVQLIEATPPDKTTSLYLKVNAGPEFATWGINEIPPDFAPSPGPEWIWRMQTYLDQNNIRQFEILDINASAPL